MPARKRVAKKSAVRRKRTGRRVGARRRTTVRSKPMSRRVVTENKRKHKWVIPRHADRAHYILDDAYEGKLQYVNPAASINTAGFVIPTNILDQNLVPFNASIDTQLRYGLPSTETPTSPIACSSNYAVRQPGILTAFQRYRYCVVTGASLRFELSQDSSNPAAFALGTTEVKIAPMSPEQLGLLSRMDSISRPTCIYPSTAGYSDSNMLLHNGVKSSRCTNFAGSQTTAKIRHSMLHSKYMPLMYQAVSGNWCKQPAGSPVTTNPGVLSQCGFFVQLHVPNLASSQTIFYTMKIKLRLYCTFFEPLMTYLLTTPSPPKEEKKEVEPIEDSEEDEFSDGELDAMPGRTPVGGPHLPPAMPEALPPKAMAPPGPVPGRAQVPADVRPSGRVRKAVHALTSQGPA